MHPAGYRKISSYEKETINKQGSAWVRTGHHEICDKARRRNLEEHLVLDHLSASQVQPHSSYVARPDIVGHHTVKMTRSARDILEEVS